jgi:ATP-dependent DNA ligase
MTHHFGLKYKVNRGQEFVIGGYTPGNPFDALIVGHYEGERLLYAAKIRNGFVPLVAMKWQASAGG